MTFEEEASGNITLRSRSGVPYSWNPRYWEGPERRRESMRGRSVDLEVLSVSGSLLGYGLAPQDALNAARELNDEIAETCRAYDEILGLGTIPLPDSRFPL